MSVTFHVCQRILSNPAYLTFKMKIKKQSQWTSGQRNSVRWVQVSVGSWQQRGRHKLWRYDRVMISLCWLRSTLLTGTDQSHFALKDAHGRNDPFNHVFMKGVNFATKPCETWAFLSPKPDSDRKLKGNQKLQVSVPTQPDVLRLKMMFLEND